MSIFLIGKKLGKGSFGSVYEIEDEKRKKSAVKVIDTKNFNYILEASITSTYRHPNLVSSEDIFIENHKLYIVQEKAIADLMVLSRDNPIKLPKAREYMYSISKAVKFLHSRNIIHGDIKASNIFLYRDGNVKLGDFSVSLISYRKSYTHSISTPSHNPPECFNHEEWSFPIDIWCLGCTIYEVVYGRNFFPSQKECTNFDRNDMLKLCVFDWLTKSEGISIDIQIEDGSEIDYEDLDIKHVKHPKNFYDKKNISVNNLIMKMMKSNPEERLNINQVINHKFFDSERDNSKNEEMFILKNKKHDLDVDDVKKLNNLKKELNITDDQISNTASKILSLCTKEFLNEHKKEIYQMCYVISMVLNKQKIPSKLKKYDPEILISHLGYSIHESL